MDFRLLGPLIVQRGERVLPIPEGKQRAVLAVLLLRSGRTVPIDELIDLIWTSDAPPSARATLHNYVKRLRQALGGTGQAPIRTSGSGYLIEATPDELDVTRFQALCESGRAAAREEDWELAAARLRTALSLWRGQPLTDIPCPALTDDEVPHLIALKTAALEDRIDADLRVGRHRQVIPELQRLAGSDPLRERVHTLLMLALYRAGRQADALASYQKARNALVSELGLEPGNDLRRMHERILAADPGLDLPAAPPSVPVPAAPVPRQRRRPTKRQAPRQVPATGGYFVARGTEVDALTRLLDARHGAAGSVPISVICGGAGVGKTALAMHWAHQVADRFPDGQLYADLRGFAVEPPVSPADVVRGFLDTLRVPGTRMPAGPAAQGGLFRSLLAGRRMLILLDNAADASQVRPLLPASPGSLVVVTSRRQLTGLAAAEGAQLLTLGTLTDSVARELLELRLGTRRVRQEAAAATELIRICAGLPLALTAAIGRLTSGTGMRLATLTRGLSDPRSLLDTFDTGDPATSLRPVLSWSCQKLSAPAAHLLQLIGARGRPDLALSAAAALARTSEGRVRGVLAELTQLNLAAEHSAGRLTIHPLLLAYAAEQARPVTITTLRPARIPDGIPCPRTSTRSG